MAGGDAFWFPLAEPASGGGGTELLVMDGTTPPEPLTLEDGTDYLYKDS